LSGICVVVALLLVARLYFVQIVRGEEYERKATTQYVAQSPETKSRGSIYFTTKDGERVSAAVMQTGWRIALQPKDLTDATGTFEVLNSIVPIDRERYFASAGKPNDPYEEIAVHVSDSAADAIRAKRIPGVLLVQDQWRFYPAHELAAQTIGFVGYQGGGVSKVGVYGLEKQWEDTLVEQGSGLFVNPFAEIFASIESAISLDPASHQGSIVTSIEPSVEATLETTLDAVMKEYSPVLAGGIVMDPHTGKIYAMAARPSYDPNTYSAVADHALFGNPLVEGRFELGSIMKPLTMGAGIDAGAVSPATTFNDTGCTTRSGKEFCDFDKKVRGIVSMQEVLNQSLNLGATFVADTMGHPVFTRYLKAYQLGQKTGIDLPTEVMGSLEPLGEGDGPDVNYANASFGQGIAVSPIGMTRALATLANGGVLPNPHVVSSIRYDSGIMRDIPTPLGARVLSTSTAETVTNMLITVFDNSLLHGALKQEHYSIAAKTGTAQIAIPHTGGYYTDRYLHSFFGYFPAHNPRFIVFLFALEPHGQMYASATLARPFMDIAHFLINYYDIPPDR
jgi:cell division protein FtsI/penicillin-binding protein 2